MICALQTGSTHISHTGCSLPRIVMYCQIHVSYYQVCQKGASKDQHFIIYINDLLKSFPSGSVFAYANDVSLFSSGATLAEVEANVEAALAHVSTWAENNGLVISISKCAAILVSLHIKKATVAPAGLRFGKAVLNTVHEMRIIGVTLSSDLKWSTHALNVRASVSKMVGVLNRFGCSLNIRTRQKFCRLSLFLSWYIAFL